MSDVDGRTRRAAEVREQRRAQILEAALSEFATRGYHGTSVSDVVAAAGVARGTFYLYFDSKEAIFRELLDDLLATLRSSIRGVDVAAGDAEAQLDAIVAGILRTVESNRPLTRIIFREAVGLDDAVDARLAAFYGELFGYVEQALQLGHAVGMIRPLPDVEVAATAVLGALRGVVQRYVVDADDPFDVDAVAAAVVDLTLRGLLPGGSR